MIKATNVSFGFPQKELYQNIYFEIEDGDHAVLIGSNGTGKSTLISMIMDHEKYLYDGKIEIPEDLRIGYVSQYTIHEGNENVFDYLAAPFTELLAKADETAAAMGEAEDMDAAFEEFQKYQDEIEAMDAYNYEVNIRKQLATAGLEELSDHNLDQISGGEYKLLAIIRNMLLKPHLLIMDEPDAFLDFENLVGLSRLINGYEGTLLVVSHNRLLLGQCFDKILHLENCELQEFPGTFAEYNHSMLETKTLMAEQAKKDEEWIEIQKKVLDRLRKTATMVSAPKLGAQVHARASYLERLQARKAQNPFIEDRSYNLHFPDVEMSEEKELKTEENVGKMFEADATETADKTFEANATETAEKMFEVNATETAEKMFEGNATETAEKTFEVNEIETVEKTFEGNATETAEKMFEANATETTGNDYDRKETAANKNNADEIVISMKDYTLSYDKLLLSNVNFEIKAGEKVALVGANGTGKSSMLRDMIRQVKDTQDEANYAYFAQIYEDTEQMSGGEKNLKQLRKICETSAKILLLDEPSSHLDTYAQIALENAIREYKGTVLMVSHDFYTVVNCVDRILLIEDGTLKEMSTRAFRKRIYKRYFSSDVFEQEKKQKDLEIRVHSLLKNRKIKEAKSLLGIEETDD